METCNNEAQNSNYRQQSDVEIMYSKMQSIFGGKVPWNNLDLHAQQVFVQSVNNIIQISQLGG